MTEQGPRSELPTIDKLLEDNRSEQAEENRTAFREARLAGQIYVIRTCSDSRAVNGIPPNRCIHVPSIAAAGSELPYYEMNKFQPVLGVINAVHYDGLEFKPGEMPSKCGGLDAKKLAKINPERAGKMIEEYIDHQVPSEDPIITNFFNSANISTQTEKPVLAAIQDHRSGIFYPVALFLNRGTEIRTNVPINYLMQGQYSPEIVYKNGVPILDDTQLTPGFRDFFDLNKTEVERLQSEYPNFVESTENQNPEYLILTSEKTTARERYPHALAVPSSYFSIHVPRGKAGEQAFIANDAVESVVAQAQYPLEHFSNIRKVLIETPDLYQSKTLAGQLVETIDENDWVLASKSEILVAGSIRGKTTTIERFKKIV